MKTQEIIEQVNDAINKVFEGIPKGFKEYIYEEVLCYELEKRNIKFHKQKRLPFYWEGQYLCSYVPDLLIPTKDGDYVLELKHKAKIDGKDEIQLERYLFNMNQTDGSIVNFGNRTIKDYVLVDKNKLQKNTNEPRISEKAQQIIDAIKKVQDASDEPATRWIGQAEIAKITNINDSTVKSWLRKLVDQDVLIYEKGKGYQFNENKEIF
tara:strand:- start:141 stop:767 length:627 start_codon:yes stop_codon:yes gene_type:complete